MEYSSVLKENRQRSKMQASPLMFESDDEDTDPVDDSANSSNKENAEEGVESVAEPSKEERILKGFQTVLMGIPPPPAFTVPQLDCREILKLWRENQSFRIALSPGKCKNNKAQNNKLEEEAKITKWPKALQIDFWDVYYNKSSASEELERLSIRYKERYVGAETSSCINALFAKSPMRTASARKRARNRAWGHSPGRRLSHLARRRKAFSSASLCSVAGNNNPDKKMIMVEIKKIGNRQKKRVYVKKTKPTPKKKSEPQSSNFKRALFQSPDQDPVNVASKTPSAQGIQRSKRNLFSDSSEKKNEFGKRERPVPKRVSPRKRVNRSLSFQESSQPPSTQRLAPAPAPVPQMTQPPQILTGAHKQKMLWAATNALREEGMGMSHELFRPCMTVLFRTCQRLWLTKAGVERADTEGSTSERMLALAKQFSTYTIQEISSDPTAEHMALVYNNSLKMAEKVLNQPCSSGVISGNSKTGISGVTDYGKQKKIKTDKNIPVFNNSYRLDGKVGKILVDAVDSSEVKIAENRNESMTRTPDRSKITSENESGQSSNLGMRNTLDNLLKTTPSNVRDSPRSSPRLTRKSGAKVKVDSSDCRSSVVLPAEANMQACGKVVKEDMRSVSQQEQCKDNGLVPNKSKSENGVPSCSENPKLLGLSLLGKESSTFQRQTPIKGSVPVGESPKNLCLASTSCKLNKSSLVVDSINSSPKSCINSKLFNDKNVQNDAQSSADKPKCIPFVGDKVQPAVDRMDVENSVGCKRTMESNIQNKQTPVKKVSFSTISLSNCCSVVNRRPSCDARTEKPSDSNVSKNESSDTLSGTSSIIKKLASSVNFCVTESLGGRRVTRSLSTDSQVKSNTPVHHLFSPPTTQRNKVMSTKGLCKEMSKQVCNNRLPNCLEAQQTSQSISDLPNIGQRVTRRMSCNSISKSSQDSESNDKTIGEGCSNKLSTSENNPDKQKDSDHSEATNTPLKRCLRSNKSSKKTTGTRRTSWDAKSTGSVTSTISSSSQNENNEAVASSPEFVSPQTRLRKAQLNKDTKVLIRKMHPSKATPDKLASSAEFVSPEIRLRKATLNKRLSVVSSDGSPFKDTPDKSALSDEYSADTENSSGTVVCMSQNNSVEEKSSDEYETNKENLGEDRLANVCSNDKNPNHRHLLSVENTPSHQLVAEEPMSRMLQLYRLSSSGGDNETEKLLPEIVCLEPPKLVPHWSAEEYESEEAIDPQESPPSLAPHWEQESCSGTSTSLPESIMAHWQQISSKVNDDSSDKVMFDFEDTSYEITFPSANEDSRASSSCAPFDFPHFVDDSKSGFINVFRRSSTELSE